MPMKLNSILNVFSLIWAFNYSGSIIYGIHLWSIFLLCHNNSQKLAEGNMFKNPFSVLGHQETWLASEKVGPKFRKGKQMTSYLPLQHRYMHLTWDQHAIWGKLGVLEYNEKLCCPQ